MDEQNSAVQNIGCHGLPHVSSDGGVAAFAIPASETLGPNNPSMASQSSGPGTMLLHSGSSPAFQTSSKPPLSASEFVGNLEQDLFRAHQLIQALHLELNVREARLNAQDSELNSIQAMRHGAGQVLTKEAKMQTRIQLLETAGRYNQEEKHRLAQQKKRAQASLQSCRKSILQLQEQIAISKPAVDGLKQALDTERSTTARQGQKIAELTFAHSALEEELEDESKAKCDLEERLTSNEDTLRTKETIISDQTQSLAEAKDANVALGDELKDVKSTFSNQWVELRDQVTSAQATLSEKITMVSTLEAFATNHRDTVSQLEAENEKLRQDLQQKEDDIRYIEQRHKEECEKVDSAVAKDADEKEETIMALEASLAKKNENLSAMQATLEKRDMKVKRHRDFLEQLDSDLLGDIEMTSA